MRRRIPIQRFCWRAARNFIAATPARCLIFPRGKLSCTFGRGDHEYSWQVFLSHFKRLRYVAPALDCKSILEIGCGRNAGTGLLWSCISRHVSPQVVLWDVYPNLNIGALRWEDLANELGTYMIATPHISACLRDIDPCSIERLAAGLEAISEGKAKPPISYLFGSQKELGKFVKQRTLSFEYIYSHAALEHVWHMHSLYRFLEEVTAPGGYHTHRIDLADHGMRQSNYLEMCQWSDSAWWLTQRFTPGALNRWRASDHLECVRQLGMRILDQEADVRDTLPVECSSLAQRFSQKSDEDLRTTGLWLVARKA